MRERLIEYMEKRRGVPFTPASAAKSIGTDRRAVQAVISAMATDGLVISKLNSLGVTEYVYSGAQAKPPEAGMKNKVDKPRTAPYTANKIAGAYASKGNVIIKLQRRTNAKSITITKQDFAAMAAFFATDECIP